MKSNRYEPRTCIICGKTFSPGCSDQRTCGSEACKKARHRLNYLEYREKNYSAVLQANRRYMENRRMKQLREANPPKPDTIIAIGYAERQMADSLAKAGKVKVEL